jgi:hypothetical protein
MLTASIIYQLPGVADHETGMITLRLLISNTITAINNQTLIGCAGGHDESFLTTLVCVTRAKCECCSRVVCSQCGSCGGCGSHGYCAHDHYHQVKDMLVSDTISEIA